MLFAKIYQTPSPEGWESQSISKSKTSRTLPGKKELPSGKTWKVEPVPLAGIQDLQVASDLNPTPKTLQKYLIKKKTPIPLGNPEDRKNWSTVGSWGGAFLVWGTPVPP